MAPRSIRRPRPVLVLGGLMLMVGLAFKLRPYRFTSGAPTSLRRHRQKSTPPLGGIQGRRLALLVRVAIGLAGIPGDGSGARRPERLGHNSSPIVHTPAGRPSRSVTCRRRCSTPRTVNAGGDAAPAAAAAWARYIVLLLALLAAVTSTFGNLVAYGQTNINRLLAYSTIAHAGYMMMAVAAAMALAGGGGPTAELRRPHGAGGAGLLRAV